MSLQQNVIKNYRTKFPEHTLKEVSERTGIQITRVFRIFNGSEMKLKEYESFQLACAIKEENPISLHLHTLLKQCLSNLEYSQLKRLCFEIEDTLEHHKLKNYSTIEICNSHAI
jgi:hypothetical protein